MRLCQSVASRPGGITSIAAILLIPMLAMVAFAIDISYILRTDSELQNAADSAALSGTAQLLNPSIQSVLPGADVARLRQDAVANAVVAALAYGDGHYGGDKLVSLSAGDVEVGFISNPADIQSPFTTGFGSAFPNSVRVVARRDASVSTGPLALFFGPLMGMPTSDRRASATATLRGQNVTGFSGRRGVNGRLLPIGMDMNTFTALTTGSAPGVGVLLQDNYTVAPPIQRANRPPGNVSPGADRVMEANIDPDRTAPGNFGLIALNASGANGVNPFRSWIDNGPTPSDLDSFGANGLQAPLTMPGEPGMKATLSGNLQAAIGQPRIIPVFDSVSGNGNNVNYHVIGFVGATIVSASLQGNNKHVTVQLTPTIDASGTLAPGVGPGKGTFVFQGISLSR